MNTLISSSRRSPPAAFQRRADEGVMENECGVPADRMLYKRIIGGKEARFAQFPWQAHIRISQYQCGGVLGKSGSSFIQDL